MLTRTAIITAALGALPILAVAQTRPGAPPSSTSGTRPAYDSAGSEGARAYQAQAAFYFTTATTSAALSRSLDAKVQEQARAIARLTTRLADTRTELGVARADLRTARRRVVQLERQVADLARALADSQIALVDALAQRDRAYAQELAALRQAAGDILASPDGPAVLEKAAAGDWAGIKAIEARLEINFRRSVAILGYDQFGRGNATLEEILARFDDLAARGSTYYWDWLQRARLAIGALDTAKVETSAARAYALAITPAAKLEALRYWSFAKMMRGDYAEGLRIANTAVDLARDTARQHPTDVGARIDYVSALSDLASWKQASADADGSLAVFKDATTAADALLIDFPDNVDAKYTYTATVLNAADLLATSSDVSVLAKAKALTDLVMTRLIELDRLYPENPAVLIRIATTYALAGSADSRRGDQVTARAEYRAALTILRRLHGRDPSAAAITKGYVKVLEGAIYVARAANDTASVKELEAERARVAPLLDGVDKGIIWRD